MNARCYCAWRTVGGNRFRTNRRKCQACREAAAAARALRQPWADPLMATLGKVRRQARAERHAREGAAWLRAPGPTGAATAGQLARFNAARVERKYWGGWSFAAALEQVRRTT